MGHVRRVFAGAPQAALIEADPNAVIELPSRESHYLFNVLRLEIGSEVEVVIKESGHSFRAILINALPPAKLRVFARQAEQQPQGPVKSLIFALSKGSKNDLVCEKAVELGVQNIIFWQAERSIVRINADQAGKKRERWQKIAESAALQCGSNVVPPVLLALTFAELVQHLRSLAGPADLMLYCSLNPAARHLRDIVVSGSGVQVLIGPEGDISAEEEENLERTGFLPVTLGPLTLRAETAAIAAAAAISALAGWSKGPAGGS